jgi:hypothetical protein
MGINVLGGIAIQRGKLLHLEPIRTNFPLTPRVSWVIELSGYFKRLAGATCGSRLNRAVLVL